MRTRIPRGVPAAAAAAATLKASRAEAPAPAAAPITPPSPHRQYMRRKFVTAGSGSILAVALLSLLGLTPANAATGQITAFPTPAGSVGSGSLVVGSDGDLYAGLLKITTSGQTTVITPSTAFVPNGEQVAGPDGNVWELGSAGSATALARITPAGQVTTFPVPNFDGLPKSGIDNLAAGPDGNVWFDGNAGQGHMILDSFVGYINPATGAITQIALPSGAGEPGPIITGPDGNLWFVAGSTDDIVRVTA
jgi:streptogramin lyase